MKLLHVLHGWPPEQTGGTELYVAALTEAQRKIGLEVEVFVAGRDAQAGRGIRASFEDAEVERRFAAFLKEKRPERVHIHHLTGLSMGLPSVAKTVGIPVLCTLHDYWLACARGQQVDRWGRSCPGAEASRCAACIVPGGRTVNWWRETRNPSLTGRLRSLPLRPLLARRQRAFAALTSSVDCWLSPSRHLHLGLPTVYEPLPLFQPLPTHTGSDSGPLRFLFAGSLIPTKGPHLVLEAFATVPRNRATLRMVGPTVPFDGRETYGQELRARASALGVEVGAVPHPAMGALLATSDVLVFPSLWEENSPSILREAAAMGLPVLAHDLEAVRMLVPTAKKVGRTVEAWRRAVQAEWEGGRRTVPRENFPGMDEHVQALLRHYQSVGG